jgi:hypothetical protein
MWAITIAGVTPIPATACAVLYGGAVRAGAGRGRAALPRAANATPPWRPSPLPAPPPLAVTEIPD